MWTTAVDVHAIIETASLKFMNKSVALRSKSFVECVEVNAKMNVHSSRDMLRSTIFVGNLRESNSDFQSTLVMQDLGSGFTFEREQNPGFTIDREKSTAFVSCMHARI